MLSRVFRFGSLVTSVMLFGAWSSANVTAQDMLDLKIPKYDVTDATMEEALRELHAWGIQVCLEKVSRQNDEGEIRISVNLRNASVKEVLDALTVADKRYTWERYVRTNLINVFPVDGKEDPSYLMNLRTKKAVIKGFYSPENIVPYISYFVPELGKKLHPGGAVISMISGGVGGKMKLQIDFEFEDMTVREILNEIALRTAGKGWVYEFVKSPEPTHKWKVLGW
jgi:hypothetical protein